jgi:hypothetical protein
VPPPPASLEIGPISPPPGDNYIYTPGYWFYRDSRYVWRPGHYIAHRPGFLWIAAHHVWTPRGYLFVNGYYDRPLERRGLLFASVAFHRPLWQNPGWTWRPSYVVGFRPLLDSLFVDVRSGHYRYGDYYGTNYLSAGIQPWHTFAAKGYDPLYSHYRWENRNNPAWQAGLTKVYNDRVSGVATRPPTTLAQQALVVNQTNNLNLKVAQPVTQFAAPGVKLAKVSTPQLVQQQAAVKQAQVANQARIKAESGLAKQLPVGVGQTGAAPALKLPVAAAPKFDAKSPAGKPQVADIHGTPLGKTSTVNPLPKLDSKAAAPLIKTPLPKLDNKAAAPLPKLDNKAAAPLIKTPLPKLDNKAAAPLIKTPLPKLDNKAAAPLIKTPTQLPAPAKTGTPPPVKLSPPPPVKTPPPQPKVISAPPPVKTPPPQPKVISASKPAAVSQPAPPRMSNPPPAPRVQAPAPPRQAPVRVGGAKNGKGH